MIFCLALERCQRGICYRVDTDDRSIYQIIRSY